MTCNKAGPAGSEPYRSFPSFCRDVYGRRLERIALDAGMTCPNRDGTLGKNGCSFCAGGSGDFAVAYRGQRMDMSDFTWFHGNGARPGDFIAYFQAYTSTYAPIKRLRTIFEAALSDPVFAGISVATRPDCLGLFFRRGMGVSGAGWASSGGNAPGIPGETRLIWPDGDVVQLLEKLKEEHPDKFIWVELGLQTADDATASLVRRGYPTALYDACALELIRAGIPVITHVILGLPGESREQMLATVRHVNLVYENASGTDGRILGGCGIKLQLLHYLTGTELGDLYLARRGQSDLKDPVGVLPLRRLARQGRFCPANEDPAAQTDSDRDRELCAMTEEDYVRTVADCISVLHPDIVIHRLTGDGNSRILLAPLWSRNKRHVLNSIRHELSVRGIVQGCCRSQLEKQTFE